MDLQNSVCEEVLDHDAALTPQMTAKRSVLAVRHVGFEDLGSLEPVVRARGYDISYTDGWDPALRSSVLTADLVVILGGPVGVNDHAQYPFLTAELDVIRARIQAGLPTLGICLGAQLIAAAAGSAVTATETKEIGFAPIVLNDAGRRSVLAPLADQVVLHWHSDTFDVPRGATHLASTTIFPHQAFCIGEQVLALQFHIEVDPERIEAWLVGHAHELSAAAIDPRVIRADALRYASGLVRVARRVLDDWLQRIE
jgi:GMP synthase (glutamine-hydrolysing)